MSKIIFCLFCLLLGFAAQARTFEDIRHDATDVLLQLERGEINEAEARELLEDFEQEALQMHQKRNARGTGVVNKLENRVNTSNTSVITPEKQILPQRTNEMRESQIPSITGNSVQQNSIVHESEKSTPGGVGFLRRFISFSWLWDVIIFLGYSALVIGGIAIAAGVYETFRSTTRSIAHSTQNRNPTIPVPPIHASGISSSRPTAPQRPQQPAVIAIPHSGEVPNHLC